ncbi:MAG: two-component system, cell cycle response regulator [Thiomicrorhabdus sp.]|nr:MAG: two-component system, cell cycle response regulator [Thiomicrorhabdus sp.]
MLNQINDADFKNLILSSGSFWLNMLDEQANVVMWNKGAEKISGYSADEVLGHQGIWELLYPDETYRLSIYSKVMEIIEKGEVLIDFETMIVSKDGNEHYLSWNTHNLKNESGDIIGSIAIGREITSIKEYSIQLELLATELKQSNEKLTDLSYVDALTSIANRRAYTEKLKNELEASHSSGRELSLLMIDIDFFKQYNDIYGHEQGDIALSRVASQIEAILYRQTDLVARYGGEEFVVILPFTSLEEGKKLAEKILQSIIGLDIEHKHSHFNKVLTVSVGIASTENSFEQLAKYADDALYDAKKRGRNRVVSYIKKFSR